MPSRMILLGLVVVINSILSILPCSASGEVRYTVTDLGAGVGAYGINNTEQVVGCAPVDTEVYHAFFWENGVMSDLGTLGETGWSYAFDVNNLGQVVGWTDAPGEPSHAVVWENAAITDLGEYQTAYGINNDGQVVGSNAEGHACLWDNGTVTDLGTLGGMMSLGREINSAGQIIGRADMSEDHSHGFLWENGEMSDLGTLGGVSSEAFAINNSGQIVGSANTLTGDTRAFLWENGTMTDLGSPDDDSSTHAYGINNYGEIVGGSLSRTFEDRALLWEAGMMYDLNDLIPPNSEWTLLCAYDINDTGHIIGEGMINGQFHSYLLIPEPASVLLIVFGLATVVCRQRALGDNVRY